ncbi:MAG: hypothetical protein AVO35_13195 [Candidatus Aegiribacteria sp. MLS_C]|nr:MAG: hypothetical protein AVO35_13195 [Candidatus Aegiribacteria sp. MLS_C]
MQVVRRSVDALMKNRFVGIIIFLAVLGAVTLFAVRSISSVDINRMKDIGPESFPLPLALVILAYLNRFLFWNRLAAAFHLRARYTVAGRAFFYSILGRYVPGKAGLFLLRLRAYKGKSRKKVGAAMIAEYIATILAACILVLAGSILASGSNPLLTRWIPLGVAVLSVLMLHPRLLRRMVNSLIGLTGRSHLVEFPTAGNVAVVTAGYGLTGLLHGMALFMIMRMFGDMPFELYPVVTGAYYTAGLIGMVAFFAPGGLGVREGVLFLLLPAYSDTGAVVLSAALMRILTLAAELLLAGFFALLSGRSAGDLNGTALPSDTVD